jgi:hypothetical protein
MAHCHTALTTSHLLEHGSYLLKLFNIQHFIVLCQESVTWVSLEHHSTDFKKIRQKLERGEKKCAKTVSVTLRRDCVRVLSADVTHTHTTEERRAGSLSDRPPTCLLPD